MAHLSSTEFWYIFAGFLLISFGVLRQWSEKSPITPAMIYFFLGLLCSPMFLDRIDLHKKDAGALEAISEFIVIISVFSAALKLRLKHLERGTGRILRLALVAMILTVGACTWLGMGLLGYSLPLALLLAAMMAPTDPVLAASVQVDHKDDRDVVRQALTGEAGVNDSSAYPLVYLAVCFMGFRELGDHGLTWLLRDVLYAIGGAVVIGFICGAGTARGIAAARAKGYESLVLDDFVAVGVMAVSYGLGMLAHTYGFVAVFVAGLAFRWFFERHDEEPREGAEKPDSLSEMIRFHDQVERFGEVLGVMVVGSLAGSIAFNPWALVFAAALFFVIRALATTLSLWGTQTSRAQKGLIAWLGIRGIGSIYYLAHVASHGLSQALTSKLTEIVVPVIAASIFLHGVSSNYLMSRYRRKGAGHRG